MKKLSFIAAAGRFKNQGRSDIVLLEPGYVSWRRKATFHDLVINDTFIATPKNVYVQKSCHPKRSADNRASTNLNKFGNRSSLHGNTEQARLVKEQTKDTCLRKYGTDHPFRSKQTRVKVKDTMLTRYGVTNVSQLRKKVVTETGEYVEDWFLKQAEPKPKTYQSFGAMFLFGNEQPREFSVVDLNRFLEEYRVHKTKLELLGEKLLGVQHYNKKPSSELNYRPDFKLSEKVFVNLDGLYWHSEHQKGKLYHVTIRKEFEAVGLSLFQFREDEVTSKPSIVASIINNKLGNTVNILFARKTKVGTVTQTQATEFLQNNHLMGTIKAKHIGLFVVSVDDNQLQLVSLLSYKQYRNKAICKIERFCSVIDTVVVGGFSKLLKQLEESLTQPFELHYWTDLRYGTGTYLLPLGFKTIKETLGWKWTDGEITFNRLKCRANMDSRNITEKQHAKDLGWYKLFDSGQRLYIKHCLI